jgi:hypothetical protein
MKKSAKLAIVFCITVLVMVLLFVVVYYPIGRKETPPTGYEPIRDDMLASQYLPIFDCPPEFGPILAVYYRAAKDESGLLHIAYHPVWARERNDTKAWGPFLSRWLYTGGLSLQRAMFGIGDIESIGMTINPENGEITKIEYETAANYSPSDFSVKHLTVDKKGPFESPLCFKVMSWNHLFSLEEAPRSSSGKRNNAAPLSYFTSELWAKYSMWKNPETLLRKDRAHFVWERGVAP